MTTPRHEIPTHLNVEDKAFYGLSVRQFTFLVIGCAAGYGLFNQWPELALALRAAPALACFLLTVALALIRPGGRGLEEWAFVGVRYAAIPKASVWRPGPADPAAWRPSAARWEDLSPHVSWTEEH